MDPMWLALPGCILWLLVTALPWRPWSTRERLDAQAPTEAGDLSGVTVLIPARDEAEGIARTLRSVLAQGVMNRVILVDDQSRDGTADAARRSGLPNLMIIPGTALPQAWTGKLWALEQGRLHVETPYVLLLDADIELQSGIATLLLRKMIDENLALVSLAARLRMVSFWEKLLMPAFVYFFKLLYPFHLSNSKSRLVAAAAGGCILIRAEVLDAMGGFGALRNEIIDDCALARRVKDLGLRTWLGLTHSAISHRRYDKLQPVWSMVSRTAYTQLKYSPILLLLCSITMAAAFLLPVAALILGSPASASVAAVSILLMTGSYVPVLRYYGLSPLWSATLPVIGGLFLLMTWTSAWRHWQGAGAKWKDRVYSRPTRV